MMNCQPEDKKSKLNIVASAWDAISSRPLLLVVFAFCLFSIGIWNARDGFGEDTSSFITAYSYIDSNAKSALPSSDAPRPRASSPETAAALEGNLLLMILTAMLNNGCDDPLLAALLLRILSSFLASIAVYFILSSFSPRLSVGAVLFASFAWIASAINAPFYLSTSTSTFAFAIMGFGICFLLRSSSLPSIVGFYGFSLLAIGMRPEYRQPVILITVILIGRFAWRLSDYLNERWKTPPWKTKFVFFALALVCGTLVIGRTKGSASSRYMDQYMLIGLGQCYADYYHRQHPDSVYESMTEYQELLDKTFNNPTGFFDAIKKNPAEMLRYLCHNGFNNLSQIPNEMFRVRARWASHGKWPSKLVLLVLAGGILATIRVIAGAESRERIRRKWGSITNSHSDFWKIVYLCVLGTTPIISILLLVPSPRYWIALVPILYVILAFCVEISQRRLRLSRYEHVLVMISLLAFCTPNFLLPRPNYRVSALRHLAPHIRSKPTIGALWANPDCIFGFCGNAIPISVNDGIYEKDIIAGRFDVLIIDPYFRGTRTWNTQQDFFVSFEREPGKYGFRKLTEVPTGIASIFYRENPEADFSRDALYFPAKDPMITKPMIDALECGAEKRAKNAWPGSIAICFSGLFLSTSSIPRTSAACLPGCLRTEAECPPQPRKFPHWTAAPYVTRLRGRQGGVFVPIGRSIFRHPQP
jgi:hypothetical protein